MLCLSTEVSMDAQGSNTQPSPFKRQFYKLNLMGITLVYLHYYTKVDMAKKGTRTFRAVKGLGNILDIHTYTLYYCNTLPKVPTSKYQPYECELYNVVLGETLQNQSPKNMRCILSNSHFVRIVVIQTIRQYYCHATMCQVT